MLSVAWKASVSALGRIKSFWRRDFSRSTEKTFMAVVLVCALSVNLL